MQAVENSLGSFKAALQCAQNLSQTSKIKNLNRVGHRDRKRKKISKTHLRKMILDKPHRRSCIKHTSKAYIRALKDFASCYHLPPDRLGPVGGELN